MCVALEAQTLPLLLDVGTEQVRVLKVESDVASLAWSPPDSQVLCVTDKGRPTLFDATNGQNLGTLAAPDAKPDEFVAGSVAWSPDGRWLAGAVRAGKQIRIRDAATKEHKRTIETELFADSLSWHKESQLLSVTRPGGPATCVILDTTSGEVAAQSPAIGGAYDVDWSPAGLSWWFTQGCCVSSTARPANCCLAVLNAGRTIWTSTISRLFCRRMANVFIPSELMSPERLEFDAELDRCSDHEKSRWDIYRPLHPMVAGGHFTVTGSTPKSLSSRRVLIAIPSRS